MYKTRKIDEYMPVSNYVKYYYYLCGRFNMSIDSYRMGDFTFGYDDNDRLYCFSFGKQLSNSKVCSGQDKIAISEMRTYERLVIDESIEY